MAQVDAVSESDLIFLMVGHLPVTLVCQVSTKSRRLYHVREEEHAPSFQFQVVMFFVVVFFCFFFLIESVHDFQSNPKSHYSTLYNILTKIKISSFFVVFTLFYMMLENI